MASRRFYTPVVDMTCVRKRIYVDLTLMYDISIIVLGFVLGLSVTASHLPVPMPFVNDCLALSSFTLLCGFEKLRLRLWRNPRPSLPGFQWLFVWTLLALCGYGCAPSRPVKAPLSLHNGILIHWASIGLFLFYARTVCICLIDEFSPVTGITPRFHAPSGLQR